MNYLKNRNHFGQFAIRSILWLFSSTTGMLFAQDQCPPTPLFITTQTELNQFAIDYPNCTEINGDVRLERNSMWNAIQINDLTPLQNIQRINGELTLYMLPDLTSLEGLNIASIEGNLTITGIEGITSLSDWTTLEYIGGDIELSDLTQLTDLSVLSQVTAVNGNLSLSHLPQLYDLTDLQQLSTITGNFYLAEIPNLTNLQGLNQLQSIGGDLSINSIEQLQNLSGIDQLQYVGGHLGFVGNKRLYNLDGIANLPATFQSLSLVFNPSLTICEQPSLLAFLAESPDTHPRSIEGNNGDCADEFKINDRINSPNPSTTLAPITLFYQFQVDDFSNWFPEATVHSSDLLIADTPDFTHPINHLTGLQGLSTITNGLTIRDLPNLTSLNGLSQLTTVGGSFVITNNASLPQLDALSNLETVGGDLDIINCNQLINLDGLQNLNSVEGRVYIYENNLLQSIDALSNLSNTFNGLTIAYNANLNDCNFPIICNYLAQPAATHPRFIQQNAGTGNCRSLDFVVSACQQSTCPPADNLIITTQEQLIEFQNLYPNCTEIQGDLLIGNSEFNSTVTDLSPLNSLRTITGSVKIIRNPLLTSLNGLNLESIGQDLIIGYEEVNNLAGNTLLTDVDALSNLVQVGRDIKIANNPALVQLTGLNTISSAVRDIWVDNMSSLSQLNTFNNIPTARSVRISNASALQSINGFMALSETSETLEIAYCDQLSNVLGFQNLTQIGDDLAIFNCANLVHINGFAQLQTIENALTIKFLPQLQQISGLTSLQIVSELQFESLDSLESMDGLSNLREIDALTLRNLNLVTNVDALMNITELNGLELKSNPSLTNLHGLAGLTQLNQYLNLEFNTSLSDISALQNVVFGLEFNSFSILANDALALCHFPNICNFLNNVPPNVYPAIFQNSPSCDSLEAILANCTNSSSPIQNLYLLEQTHIDALSSQYTDFHNVPNNVYIGSLSNNQPSSITDLSSLLSLQTINGSLYVQNTTALTSLNGLQNLQTLGSSPNQSDYVQTENNSPNSVLVIRNNALLNSAVALSSTNLMISHLDIIHNPQLNVCELSSVCEYLQLDELHYTRNILLNGPLCSNEEDLLNACEALNIADHTISTVRLYPNPAKSEFYIGGLSATVEVKCYSITGQLIQKWNVEPDTAISISDLPVGVYHLQFIHHAQLNHIQLIKSN